MTIIVVHSDSVRLLVFLPQRIHTYMHQYMLWTCCCVVALKKSCVGVTAINAAVAFFFIFLIG